MSGILIAIPGPPGASKQHLEAEMLTSFLRQRGHQVALIDLTRYATADLAAQRITCSKVSTIYWHLPTAREISTLMEWESLGLLRCRSDPPSLTIAGGHVATHFANELLSKLDFLQAIVRGEPEIPVAWLLERTPETPWSEGPSLVTRGGEGKLLVRAPSGSSPLPLSELPPAADDLIEPSKRPTQRVLISRGCQSACSYCGFSRFFATLSSTRSKLWRSRPAKEIADEIARLQEHYGMTRFAFQSAVFFGYDAEGSRAIEDLCEELTQRQLHIRFQIVTHPGQLLRNAALLPLLKQAGLDQVTLGLDSGSDDALRRFNVEHTSEQGLEALALLSLHEISVQPSFIFYDPYTTAQDIHAQIRFLERAHPYFRKERRPYSYFLDRHLLKRFLEAKPFMPMIDKLKADGLVRLDMAAPWKGTRVRFRDSEVDALYRAHLQVDRQLLKPLRPILWNRRWTEVHPELELLPLEVIRNLANSLGSGKLLQGHQAMQVVMDSVQKCIVPLCQAIDRFPGERQDKTSRALSRQWQIFQQVSEVTSTRYDAEVS